MSPQTARNKKTKAPTSLQSKQDEAARRFQASLIAGQDWFEALLDAIGSWTTPSETHDGREYRYLVGGEAFDWLLLAERLTLGVDGLIPDDQREALLLRGRPPRPMAKEEVQERIGAAKHSAVMNFWYGVQVEEALVLAAEQEVRKAYRGMAEPEGTKLDNVVYERVYGRTRADLLRAYYAQRKEVPPDGMSLGELQEFTYWLFKYRVEHSEPACLASDTRKGLDFLRAVGREEPYAWS